MPYGLVPYTTPSGQTLPDPGDLNILVAAIGGTGVVSGCAVSATDPPGMTLNVAGGTISVSGTRATVSGGTVSISTADSQYPRLDLVWANGDGSLTVTAGTPDPRPLPPALPAGKAALALVSVPPNATAIGANQLTDKRVILLPAGPSLSSTTPAAESVGASASIGTGTTAARADHRHQMLSGAGFRARASSQQTGLTANGTTVVNFATEDYDDGSNYSTASSAFVAPQTGNYAFSGAVSWPSTAAGTKGSSARAYVSLYVGGLERARCIDVADLSNQYTLGFAAVLKLNAGDSVDVRVFLGSSSPNTSLSSVTSTTWFSGAQLP